MTVTRQPAATGGPRPETDDREATIRRNVAMLRGARDPGRLLVDAFRLTLHEGHRPAAALKRVANSFAVDMTDLIVLIKEAAKA